MSHDTHERWKSAPSGIISWLAAIILVLGVLALTGCDLDRDHGGGPDHGGSRGGSGGGHSDGCH